MLVLLFRLLSTLPLPLLHLLGAWLGWLVYLLAPSYRRRLRDNLTRAGFADVLPQAIAEAGKAIVELPFIWCARMERVERVARVENYELVQSTLAAGHGLIFLTPHLGCFEITAQQVSRHDPVTVMYRPPRKSSLKPLVEGARARGKMKLAPANLSGVRLLAKTLRRGEQIGILPDQVPQEGEGVWAPFFGRPAYTMTLPAKLSRMNQAPIILTYAERLPRGAGFVVRFLPFTGSLEGDAAQQARAINAAMEEVIARCPAQYFWSYNRYKQPDGVAAPDEVAA